MLFAGKAAALVLVVAAAIPPAAAQSASPLTSRPSGPGESTNPDQLRRYTECMSIARNEPKRAMTVAENWSRNGGGLGARHCTAVALFESGRTA